MPGSWSVKVADADQYRIAVAGVSIDRGAGQSGYADGEFFSSTMPKDGFTLIEGTDGAVTRSKTNSRVLELSINLLQSSSSNDVLSAMFLSDYNNSGGAGIGSFTLQDLQGTTLIRCSSCWIRKPADISLDRGAKERKWPLHAVWDIYLVGSN